MWTYDRAQIVQAEANEILVEVAKAGRQLDRFDPGRLGTRGQSRDGTIARGIDVASDVESTERVRKEDGGQMPGRKGRHHRHVRQDHAQGQHRLDPFTGRHSVVGPTEPHSIAKQRAHGFALCLDRRLPDAIPIEPRPVPPVI